MGSTRMAGTSSITMEPSYRTCLPDEDFTSIGNPGRNAGGPDLAHRHHPVDGKLDNAFAQCGPVEFVSRPSSSRPAPVDTGPHLGNPVIEPYSTTSITA